MNQLDSIFQIIPSDGSFDEDFSDVLESFIGDFSHDSKSPSLNSSVSDLNTGSYCQKNEQEIIFDYLDIKDEKKRYEIIEYYSKRYGLDEGKLMKVLKRLSQKDECCRTGYVGYVREIESGDVHLEYIPRSCGCEICPYCSEKKRKHIFMQVTKKVECYLNKNYKVDFFTITYKKIKGEDLLKAYDDFTRKIRKLYRFFLGKKNIRKWKEKTYQELKEYLSNIKDEKEREKKRIQHEYYVEETFKKIMEKVEKGAKYFYEIFPYLFLKIELTYDESFYIHAHGIAVESLSRFAWVALMRMLNFGYVFYIRPVRNVRNVVSYLGKYLLKADNLIFENLKDAVIYEYVMYGRRKLREWGGDDVVIEEKEEDYIEEMVYVMKLSLKMELRKHPSRLKKVGIPYIGGEFEFRGEKFFMLVDKYGRFILEERFFEQIKEEIYMDMYPVLYKFRRRVRRDSEIVKERL